MGILARIVDGLSEAIGEILHGERERTSSSPGMTVHTMLADADTKARALRRLAKCRRTIARCDQAARDSKPATPPWGVANKAVND